MREFISLCIATFIMTIVFALFLNYLLFIPIDTAFVYGLIITLLTLIGHELVHRFTATLLCNMHAEFRVTSLAIELTLFSILILCALILLKQYTGFYTYIIPIVASPGAVFIGRMHSNCSDNVASYAPAYNLIVGIVTLMYLYTVTDPPFVLNDINNYWITLLALISYFSFALAFINSLPLKFGDTLALDGWHALNIDPSDKFVTSIIVANIVISFIVLFVLGIWVIQIPAG